MCLNFRLPLTGITIPVHRHEVKGSLCCIFQYFKEFDLNIFNICKWESIDTIKFTSITGIFIHTCRIWRAQLICKGTHVRQLDTFTSVKIWATLLKTQFWSLNELKTCDCIRALSFNECLFDIFHVMKKSPFLGHRNTVVMAYVKDTNKLLSQLVTDSPYCNWGTYLCETKGWGDFLNMNILFLYTFEIH